MSLTLGEKSDGDPTGLRGGRPGQGESEEEREEGPPDEETGQARAAGLLEIGGPRGSGDSHRRLRRCVPFDPRQEEGLRQQVVALTQDEGRQEGLQQEAAERLRRPRSLMIGALSSATFPHCVMKLLLLLNSFALGP